MPGFPIAWEEPSRIDQLSEICPYSLTEIEDYLFTEHGHWVHGEEPTQFDVSGPQAQRLEAERRYWLFEARDKAKHRQWFVVIGTGKSPFNPSEKMKRWMYAETNDDGRSPEKYL